MEDLNRKIENIRKEIHQRRKQYLRKRMSSFEPPIYEEEDEFTTSVYEPHEPEEWHPLWNREKFLFKTLSAALLFLIIAIIFQSPAPRMLPVKETIKNTMNQEFQFTVVAEWYEKQFGQPLVLFPSQLKPDDSTVENQYALPVTGIVIEPFTEENLGVIFQTSIGEEVEAMSEGTVIFAGKKDDLGNTVIIQHADYTESWYGNLEEITVKPREKVKAGHIIGVVSTSEDKKTGEFYFAIKQRDEFVDPIQVMKIE